MNNGQINQTNNCQNRACFGRSAWVIKSIIKRHISQIKEQQNQLRSKPCIPNPPSTPHRLAPNCTCSQCNNSKSSANRCRNFSHNFGHFNLPNKTYTASDCHNGINRHRQYRTWHMNKNYSVAVSLLVISGCDNKRPIKSNHHQHPKWYQKPRC